MLVKKPFDTADECLVFLVLGLLQGLYCGFGVSVYWSYEENKKKFWKEVRRVKKGGSRMEETVKDVNGRLLRGNEARKRWAEYFGVAEYAGR